MGYLNNSGSGFLSNAVTTVSNVKSYLVNKTGYLVDSIRVGIGDFGQRVLDDGGTVEASAEAASSYREITKDIYDQASLVLFPSGYKDNLLYSHKPVNGSGDFTYTRGTDTATRVGADGYIKKERANLLEQSNQFDTTWALSGGSTLSQNAVGIDNIPNTAWTFTKDSTFDGIKQNISKSGINTFSVYAKKIDSSVNELVLRINVAGGNRVAIFDLSNGTKVSMTSDSSAVHYDIQKAGNGWYRCSFVVSGTIANVDIRMDYNQTGTGSMLVQNAQLEEGLVATPYIETTTAPVYEGLTDNLPRIDYTGGTPSLLLEPSRTNLILQSEYFNFSGYTTFNSIINDNATTSPEGLINAAEIAGDGTTAQVFLRENITLPSVGNYTFSLFAKYKDNSDATNIMLDISSFGNGNGTCFFNIENGVKGTESGVTGNIEDYGSGWYRCSITTNITDGADLFGRLQFYAANSSESLSFSPNNANADLYIYGFQMEEGSHPTSYIPTYGSSATRNTDVTLSLTNAGADGLINNYNTTIFINLKKIISVNNVIRFVTLFPNGGANNPRVLLYGNMSNALVQYRVTGQADQSITSPYNRDEVNKIAIRISGTSLTMFHNGEEVNTITIVQGDDLEYLSLAESAATDSGYLLNQLLSFPTALSDDECIALTAL